MTRYSPWGDLASREHLTLAVTRLPSGRGWWMPDLDGIALDDRQSQAELRCALAHELVHAERGDTPCRDDNPRVALRQEQHADRTAARRLVTVERLAAGLLWALDEHELADELNVDVSTLRTRLDTPTDDERREVDELLWAREADEFP